MFRWMANRNRERIVERVYAEIVAQARQTVFYEGLGVPDTMEGRYEMMVLHAFLLLDRFRDADATAKDAAQAVCDHFFLEMDRAMREMGVGDLTVPKKMKKIAGLYTARASAFAAALDSADEAELASLIARALVGESHLDEAAIIAAYVRATRDAFARVDAMALIQEKVAYPDPAAFLGARQ